MAVAHVNMSPTAAFAVATSSFSCSSCYVCRNWKGDLRRGEGQRHSVVLGLGEGSGIGISICAGVSRVFGKRSCFNVRRWVLNATDTRRLLDNAPPRTTTASTTVNIPLTCYQLLGVHDRAEKDEIVKSVMHWKSAELEEGYTMDAVVSRQELLMDVRDKLLFEPEYAGNVREKIPPKSSLQIPWAWLPGALCLLQEVGEEKLVLNIGQAALQNPDAKPYIHDLLLCMALAECAIAKSSFEKNKVSIGFEALARAQCLLRSKTSLGKLALLSQIEESLEELAPACTMELLGMPHSPENAERRLGAIAALHELLRQGLDVESSCRVQDWPCFLSQALNRLMAKEMVDLLPWDDLALARKNKKSLESQNQRIVIDFNCFFVALMAHVALGFSSKQTELIKKAKIICECLMASENADLKFEEAFCLFLLGQGNEAEVIEKLQQLELNSNPAGRSLVPVKELKDASGVKPSLETWLKEMVLVLFSDTRDCSPSLANFFSGERRTSVSRKSKVHSSQDNRTVASKSLSDIAMKRMNFGESIPYMNSSKHLGSAAKQLTPTDLQRSLTLGKSETGNNVDETSIQLKRKLGAHNTRAWKSWLAHEDNTIGKILAAVMLGCFAFFTFKLSRKVRIASELVPIKPNTEVNSFAWRADCSLEHTIRPASISGSSVAVRLKKLLAQIKMLFRNQLDPKQLQSLGPATRMASSTTTVSRKEMPVEEAEALVKHWQAIKAEALGSSHQVHSLSEVLDESMLAQWQALADAAKTRSCYWRFVLLRLSVLQADILSVGYGLETAEVEALIEEAAELVDESQQKNPNYYR
uniref:Plastid division protein CDP1ic-like isoform X1 n=1 Tax=Rhizophora mucronata TaxID=61149 RepID=A0A2P2KJ07_RHIMU